MPLRTHSSEQLDHAGGSDRCACCCGGGVGDRWWDGESIALRLTPGGLRSRSSAEERRVLVAQGTMDKKVSVSFCLPGLRETAGADHPGTTDGVRVPSAGPWLGLSTDTQPPHGAEREAAKHPARAGRGCPPAPAPRGGRREGRRPRRLSPGAAGKMFQGAVHEGNSRVESTCLGSPAP